MGDGADFASYVVARWPALVRTLVLLGSTPDQAESDVVEGLSRGRSSWDRVRREDDVEVWVYRLVLDARRRGSQLLVFDAPGIVDQTIVDLDERVALLERVQAMLTILPPEEREVVVLRCVGDLDTGQVADVLGVGHEVVVERLGEPVAPHLVREASEVIPLRPPPVAAVAARARDRRRRVVSWTAAGAAAVLLVVAAGTRVGSRPDDSVLPDPVVTEADNPADVAWYADGALHLEHVTVELPQIADMVEVPDGVVFADRAGLVSLVDGEGRLTELGRTEPGTPIAGSGDGGWVTWLEIDGGASELVVQDTLGSREIARWPVDPGARPIAVDQDTVYYSQGEEAWAWTAAQPEPTRQPRDDLLDVASAVRASGFGETAIMITQPLLDLGLTVPGKGGLVSPDGDYVLTRVNFGPPDEVRVYEAATGDRVFLELDHQKDVAVAATFGPDHTVTLVLAVREHEPESGEFMRLSNSGPHTLRTCELDLGTCESVTQFANNRGQPVLPH